MKRIHILESTLKYLLDEGRNAEKAKQKTIAVMKSYLSQNGVQGGQLESMAMEYENSFKEWLFHANMPDSIIRLEPIMANVAMQLGFTPQNKDTRELYRLQDITNFIIANYQKDDFPIALNKLALENTTFESLNELFGSAIDASKGAWKPSNDGKLRPHYTVKRLDTFEEANEYHPYTQDICYLGDDETWDDYTCNGRNAVYVLLRDGWEDVPAEHGKGTPYDDYGKSMVFVIIRPNGDVAYTNTRWNHNTDGQGPRNVDQSFTDNMNEISDMLQTDYRNVLKPYTEEELIAKGVYSISMLRKWVSEGKDILKICNHEKFTDDFYKCYVFNDEFILYNINTRKIAPINDTALFDARQINSDIIKLRTTDGKETLINKDGVQISKWYKSIDKFIDGLAIVHRDDGKWSFINLQGKQIGNWYKNVRHFENGYVKVERDDGKWSLINTNGEQICDWYKEIDSLNNDFVRVQGDDGKEAIINMKGQQISNWYKDVGLFRDGFARVVREDGNWSFINMKGHEVFGLYKHVDAFENGFARIQRDDGKWSLISTQGEQICDWYRDVWLLKDGCAAVQRDDGKWSFINTEGQQICDWYRNVWPFCNGRAKVQRDDGKCAYISMQGQQISDWYQDAFNFRNGCAAVQRDDSKWTFINTQGQQICDWYRDVSNFVNGVGEVERNDGMISLINADGKRICDWFPPKTHFEIVSPNEIYDNHSNKLIPLYNESRTRLNNLIAEALHASIRNYLLYN